MKILFWKLCVFLGVILPGTGFLNAAQQKNIPPEYNAKNSLKFIDHLILKKEFYRGYAELQRFKFLYKNKIYPDRIKITELMLKYYNNYIPNNYNYQKNNLFPAEKIFISDYYYQKNNFKQISNLLKSNGNLSPEIRLLYNKRIFAVKLLNNNKIEKNIFYDDKSFFKKYNYLEDYSKNEYARMKSPGLALFSGLFPGMGYIYADKTGTGIISFILISALSVITYGAWKNNSKPVAIFTGTIGTFFYGGSIVGGYMQTRKYNQILKDDLKKYLGEELDFEPDRRLIYQKYGIGQLYD